MAKRNNNRGINYSIGLNTDGLRQSAQEASDYFKQIGDRAARYGVFVDKYITQGFNGAGAAARAFKQTSNELTQRINAQKAVVQQLQNEYNRYKAAANNTTTAGQRMGAQARATERELNAEKQALADMKQLLQEIKAQQESTGGSNASFRTQLRQTTNELMQLKTEYAALSDGEKSGAAGQELLRQMEQLKQKAAELRVTMNATNKTLKNLASPTATFNAITSGLTLTTDVAGGAMGAMQLFGLQTKDAIEVQADLSSAMAITNSLTSIQTATLRSSVLIIKVAAIQTAAKAKAEELAAVAQKRGTVATIAATVAQKAFNLVANANPYVLLATAILSVVGALYMFSRSNKEAKTAQEEANKRAQEAVKLQQTYKEAYVKSASESATAIGRMKAAWVGLGNSLAAKSQFVKDNQSAFADLGIAIDNVADAERLFNSNDNLAHFERAMQHRAAAMGAAAAAAELYKKAFELTAQPAKVAKKDYLTKEISREEYERRRRAGDKNIRQELQHEFRGINGSNSYRYYAYDEQAGQLAARRKQAEAEKEAGRYIAQANAMQKRQNDEELKRQAELKSAGVKLASSSSKSSGRKKGKADRKNEQATQRKEIEERKKLAEQLQKELEALQKKNDEAEINTMADGAEKKRKQIVADYNGRKEELEQQQRQWREENKKANATTGENGLTADQTAALVKAQRLNEEQKSKELEALEKEQLQSQLQAMLDYLKKYGTLQEQKYAIAQEYAQKIKEVNASAVSDEEKQWQLKSLQRERDAALSQATAKNLAMNIDWGVAFDGVGNVLADIAKETIKQIDAYMETAEFKALPAESKRSYTDLHSKLTQETGGTAASPFNFKQWGQISQQVKSYQASVRTLQHQTELHAQAVDNLEKAQNELANATDDTSRQMAKSKVQMAQTAVKVTEQAMNEAQDTSDSKKADLTNSTQAASNGLKNFASYLNEMKGGSLYGFANGISKLVTSLSKGSDGVAKGLSELGGKVGGIVGAILQILDALGDNPMQFLDDLLNKIGDAISGILEQLPQLIVTIVKDVGKIVQGIIKGIGSWFGSLGGFDWTAYNNMVAIHKELDEVWDDILKKKKEYISESWGYEAAAAQREADALVKSQANAAREMAKLWISAGADWNHHSQGYKLNKNLSAQAKDEAVRVFGADWQQTIMNISPERLQQLLGADSLAQFWAELRVNAKDFYEYLVEIGNSSEKIKENEEAAQKALTFTDFDSLLDNFNSFFTDLGKTSQDFANDMEKQFRNAVLKGLINDKYKEKLKDFYAKWAKSMADGSLTADEQARLKKEYQQIVDDALKERENIKNNMGWSDDATSQNGTSGGFQSMGQETAEELNGRFTAIQMDTAAMRQGVGRIATSIDEIRGFSLLSIGHLEDISRNTRQLFEITDTLNDIKKHTQRL